MYCIPIVHHSRKHVLILWIVFLFLPRIGMTQFDLSFFETPPRSPINQAGITLPDSGWSYSFMATGHLYGSHENQNSIFPSSSFLGNSDMINGQSPSIIISLGDMVRSSKNELAIQAWKSAGKLFKAPIFNAPGNHDLDDRQAYRKAFGTNQSAFFIRDDLFLLIDTEYLREENAEKLKSFIDRESDKAAKRTQAVRHLFVCSHRMLAPLCNPELASMDELANEPFRDKVNVDEACEIFKALAKIPHTGEFWNLAGDVGTHWSVPALYGFDEKTQCHTLACGVGDTPNDRMARINIAYNGKITAEVIPLFPGGKPQSATTFTPEFWKSEKDGNDVEKTGLGNTLLSQFGKKSFWLGIILGALFVAGIILLMRKFRPTTTP